MKCKSIKPNINKICLGNFNRRIKIQTSYISPNNSPNSQATATFETITLAWALVKTNTNNQFIDGVNVVNSLNTDFYIKYNSQIDLSKQLWIELDNILYKITQIDNIDTQNNIIRFRTTQTGNKSILANKR